MDEVQFAALSSLNPAAVRSKVVSRRAVRNGDPMAVSKEAKIEHDPLKAKVQKAESVLERARNH
eukprot:8990698-Pyramimonas_sp.AAC.1